MTTEIKKFCKKHDLTENQFYGIDKIEGDLDLSSLTSIPEGFNPIVGGWLDLSSLTSIPVGFNPTVGDCLVLSGLTSIPVGFNPTVGGWLDLSSLTLIPEGFNPIVGGWLVLRSLTSIPDGFNPTVGGWLVLCNLTSIPVGFNPTVGGDLFLSNLTSIPVGFNPTVGGDLFLSNLTSIPVGFNKSDYKNKYIPKLEWQDGKYIMVDGILSEVIHKRGNIYKVCDIVKKDKISYIVTDGINYSHGSSIKEAKEDLLYKISNRDKSIYNSLTTDSKLSFKEGIDCYRVITGACGFGVKDFVEKNNISKDKKYKISEIIELTKGWYGSDVFGNYFVR